MVVHYLVSQDNAPLYKLVFLYLDVNLAIPPS